MAEKLVVIIKDADFVNSFLLHSEPHKLLVSTGNISTYRLIGFVPAVSAATPEVVRASYLSGIVAYAAGDAPVIRNFGFASRFRSGCGWGGFGAIPLGGAGGLFFHHPLGLLEALAAQFQQVDAGREVGGVAVELGLQHGG